MEGIKNAILDFIFGAFYGVDVLFSALVTFDFSVIKRVCYELSFWQYLGIFFLSFLLLRFFKFLKTKIYSFAVWAYSKRCKRQNQQENKSATRYFPWQRKTYQRLQEAQSMLREIQSKLSINFDVAKITSEQEAQIQETQILYEVKKHIIQSKECIIEVKSPLNNKESEIFGRLKNIARQNYMSIFPQVPLRAFIKMKKDDLVYYVVGGMYVDFLLVDLLSKRPLCVVEYWGEGHYGQRELERTRAICNDELKRSIFKKAGIRLVVIESQNLEEKMMELTQEVFKKT